MSWTKFFYIKGNNSPSVENNNKGIGGVGRLSQKAIKAIQGHYGEL